MNYVFLFLTNVAVAIVIGPLISGATGRFLHGYSDWYLWLIPSIFPYIFGLVFAFRGGVVFSLLTALTIVLARKRFASYLSRHLLLLGLLNGTLTGVLLATDVAYFSSRRTQQLHNFSHSVMHTGIVEGFPTSEFFKVLFDKDTFSTTIAPSVVCGLLACFLARRILNRLLLPRLSQIPPAKPVA
jgi:hypothetical protein